ncbi:MAG: hypothetical protein NVS2B9_02320 [Myxococcales bacterium]
MATRPTLRAVVLSSLCAAGLATGASAAEPSQGGPVRDAASYLRRIRAARRTGPIVLDGRMDERAWDAAPWGDGFTQLEPDEAVPGSAPTRFKVLWDD